MNADAPRPRLQQVQGLFLLAHQASSLPPTSSGPLTDVSLQAIAHSHTHKHSETSPFVICTRSQRAPTCSGGCWLKPAAANQPNNSVAQCRIRACQQCVTRDCHTAGGGGVQAPSARGACRLSLSLWRRAVARLLAQGLPAAPAAGSTRRCRHVNLHLRPPPPSCHALHRCQRRALQSPECSTTKA